MRQQDGEITPREAARILGVHEDTVREWAKEAIAGTGTQLRKARVDGSRKSPRYYLDRAEVAELAGRKPAELA